MGNEAFLRFEKMYALALKMLPSQHRDMMRDEITAHKVRMAIVYGVAAMDSYFTQKFLNKLTEHLKDMDNKTKLQKMSKTIIKKIEKLLKEAGITPKFYRQMFNLDRPYRIIYSHVSEHLRSKWTTQRFSRIDNLFEIYGIKKLSENALRDAKKNSPIKSKAIFGKKITQLVDRRNKIVHECDMNSQRKLNRLYVGEIKKDLKIISAFVSSADKIINGNFNKK